MGMGSSGGLFHQYLVYGVCVEVSFVNLSLAVREGMELRKPGLMLSHGKHMSTALDSPIGPL